MDESSKISEKISKYKGIIFDFDGTIVDLNVDWLALKKGLSDFALSKKAIEDNFTPLAERIIYYRNQDTDFYNDLTGIISTFEAGESEYIINKKLVDYINGSKNKKIAIYSMNCIKTINKFVSKYFKNKPDIISIENCQQAKPTAKDLFKIINNWGLSPNEVAFVGNSDFDLISGVKAKIKTFKIQI
jgi:HAD superfamily hydrolase (TIGR01549 family)